MDWTTDQIETLRTQFVSGARYSDMAQVMGTSTRAIGGKIFRLGWLYGPILEQRLSNGGSHNALNAIRANRSVNGFPSPWSTAGILDEFKTIFDTGASFRTIACELSEKFCVTLSRNGCIGKAKRLGWIRKESPRETRPKPIKRKGEFRFNNERLSPRSAGELIAYKADQRQKAAALSKAQFEPVTPLPFLNIPLLALNLDQCRYPHGDEHISFCGQPKQIESSYCQFHHHVCYKG